MKLFALLVGIIDYKDNPLFQCLNDVDKMNDYLISIKNHFEEVNIILLQNEKATKEAIVKNITSHLYKARDNDVALLYFSGHGAIESTHETFQDAYDNKMDCLVCFAKEKVTNEQLLAGKEIRYLFQKMPQTPHLITIVDACHSGDIVRSAKVEENTSGKVRRLSGVFQEREFSNFIFANDEQIIQQKQRGDKIYIPFKNSIHLAACLSTESSWENLNGGIFTSYLIRLLEATEGKITYNDIGRWSKISLVDATDKKQTPRISLQGEGTLSPFSNWLNMHDDSPIASNGWVMNNAKNGWHFNKGRLLGIQKGMELKIKLAENEIESLQIIKTDLEFSKVEMPLNLINVLNFSTRYEAWTEQTTFKDCRIFFNQEEINAEATLLSQELLKSSKNIQKSKADIADFWLNCFNNQMYFSLPFQPYQPLAKQIKINNSEVSRKEIMLQLKAISNWNHFFTLENPGENFSPIPIRVEAKRTDEKWRDVTGSILTLEPHSKRTRKGMLYQQFQMRIKNISEERIFVGVLTLNSDMGISSNPFDQRVVELAPKDKVGSEILFYDHGKKLCGASLDDYKEVYGWTAEWFYYKFIFNNFDDFTNSLQSAEFLQPALDPPNLLPTRNILLSSDNADIQSFVKPKKKKWGTTVTRVELINPNGQQAPQKVAINKDEYLNNEKIGPFIKKLYPEIVI